MQPIGQVHTDCACACFKVENHPEITLKTRNRLHLDPLSLTPFTHCAYARIKIKINAQLKHSIIQPNVFWYTPHCILTH